MTLIHIQTIVTNNIKLISMTPETKIRTADFVIPAEFYGQSTGMGTHIEN